MINRGLLILLFLAGTSGCITTGSKDDDSSTTELNLGPILGLIGMAVDGDDKDDYEHFFDDDCDCDH